MPNQIDFFSSGWRENFIERVKKKKYRLWTLKQSSEKQPKLLESRLCPYFTFTNEEHSLY